MNFRGKYGWMVSRKALRLLGQNPAATFTVPRAIAQCNHRRNKATCSWQPLSFVATRLPAFNIVRFYDIFGGQLSQPPAEDSAGARRRARNPRQDQDRDRPQRIR